MNNLKKLLLVLVAFSAVSGSCMAAGERVRTTTPPKGGYIAVRSGSGTFYIGPFGSMPEKAPQIFQDHTVVGKTRATFETPTGQVSFKLVITNARGGEGMTLYFVDQVPGVFRETDTVTRP